MIKAGTVSGQEIAMILYEQGVLEYDSSQYEALASGSVSAYDFIRGKLQTLDITPGQLGLEPCTGSMVVTDPDNGKCTGLCNLIRDMTITDWPILWTANYYNQLINAVRHVHSITMLRRKRPHQVPPTNRCAAITGLTERCYYCRSPM